MLPNVVEEGDISSDCSFDSVENELSQTNEEGNSGEGSSSESQREKFTQKETKNVFRLRLLVLTVLFLAAGAVSCVVFITTRGGQSNEFKNQYYSTANKVLDTFDGIVTKRLDAVNALAVAVTSHSADTNATWPFLTVSNFQQKSVAARKQSGVLFTSVVPKVDYKQRSAWENYTQVDPSNWMLDGLQYQSQWDEVRLGVSLPNQLNDIQPGYIRVDEIEKGFIRDDSYGPYYPIWETSPLLKGLVNFNLGALPSWLIEIQTCMKQGAVVIGRTLTPPPGKQTTVVTTNPRTFPC